MWCVLSRSFKGELELNWCRIIYVSLWWKFGYQSLMTGTLTSHTTHYCSFVAPAQSVYIVAWWLMRNRCVGRRLVRWLVRGNTLRTTGGQVRNSRIWRSWKHFWDPTRTLKFCQSYNSFGRREFSGCAVLDCEVTNSTSAHWSVFKQFSNIWIKFWWPLFDSGPYDS